MKIVYESNGQPVEDGLRIARVSELGTKLEVMTRDEPPAFEPVVLDAPEVLPWERLQKPKLLAPDIVLAPPGQAIVYIPVDTDRDIDATCYLGHGVKNISGGGINVGDWPSQQAFFPDPRPVWRPGDDRRHYIKVNVHTGGRAAGNSFHVILKPRGFASETDVWVKVRFEDGAVNELPAELPIHRGAYCFDVSGVTPRARLDPQTMAHAPNGVAADGTAVWESRLPHGRTQSDNKERGLYMDDSCPGAVDPITRGEDATGPFVRLRSRKLPAPVTYDGQTFHYQAAMLNARHMPEWRGATGLWTARVKTPNRKHSWPAFWMIGCDDEGRGQWPPENDIMEQFNWGTDWPIGEMTSFGQHAGPRGKNYREAVSTIRIDADVAGVVEYASLMTPDLIYWFIDGAEVGCQRNMLDDGGQLFPMLNVAVSGTVGSGDYADGSGDMLIYDVASYDVGEEVLGETGA
ncbi:glycoside hydrolase family 16 protein [Pseudoroseicyclus tamaricis]|uniref:Family 16 glycosylhydrolase n=1 Tax=Pseudoroseicyclus tamaricis TaxID=2705421 RepID=A0A6B2JX63_9RHOB|nr:family 16 glycosylhydrolase [Pseudoroseicyclus tamaricis]NDV00824.1 family 16 glycosylhydrolase [Pseudoroseicyclus tamaricis]